nr:probable inactive poly [ADP-ribose] polymerase SRO5 [Ipomoea batatas]
MPFSLKFSKASFFFNLYPQNKMTVKDALNTDSDCCSTATSLPYRTDHHDRSSCDILLTIDKSERDFQVTKDELISSIGVLGKHTKLKSVYRKAYTTSEDREKLQNFFMYKYGLKIKRGGNPNENFAWYGAPKEQIFNILRHGFVNPIMNEMHCRGIHLTPSKLLLDCLKSTIPDAEGMQHLLFCRVLLGNAEVVQPGSTQCYPSSEEFDSGVDSLVSPTKYIIWNTHMNAQILPEFMISFNVLSTTKKIEIPAHISALLFELSLMLPHDKQSIAKYQKDTEEGKITVKELRRHLRNLAGDTLLVKAIKSYQNKQKKRCSNKFAKPSTSVSELGPTSSMSGYLEPNVSGIRARFHIIDPGLTLLLAWIEHARGTHYTLFLDYVLVFPDNYQQQQMSRLIDQLDYESSPQLCHHSVMNLEVPTSDSNLVFYAPKKMRQKTAIVKF